MPGISVTDRERTIMRTSIIGTKLSRRPPDRKHPFGHGRAEYLSAIVIAAIVLAAGASSLKESLEALIHPTTPSYTPVGLLIVAINAFFPNFFSNMFSSMSDKLNLNW